MLFGSAAVMMAQLNSGYTTPTDVLGAHNVYGRGCVACHAPHSGPAGNGVAAGIGAPVALWGQDLSPLFGKTIAFGDNGTYTASLPANAAAVGVLGAHDPTSVIIMCLSCHDGAVTTVGMMKGQTVEALPITAGGTAPTFLGNDGSGTGATAYNNDHPVGINAKFGCGGYNWDCTIGATGTVTPGPNMTAFEKNYGFVVSLSVINGTTPVVTCTTCHDQHAENVYAGTIATVKGTYKTSFFLRGYYDPTVATGNSAAQFCRQCHGGEGNESHGNYAIPTT
jgi:cytochrome c553